MSTRLPRSAYLDHLARESAAFRDAIVATDSGDPVPSCPDWDADDLLWHLATVQEFWRTIVEQGRTELEEEREPERPGDLDRAALLDLFDREHEALVRVLHAAPDDQPAWTWSSDPADHTVGFIVRRQTHEALIHRLDAELAAGSPTSIDPDLALDGTEECLALMYGGTPPWGRFVADPGQVVAVIATDVDRVVPVALGRFTGTDPEGRERDEDDLGVLDAPADAIATVSGPAAALDAWLWHRLREDNPWGTVELDGDPEALRRVRAILEQPIN